MRFGSRTAWVVLGFLGFISVCPAAVTLNYTNGTITPTMTTVTANSTFSVDVVLRIDNTTTPVTGGVTGLSYRITAGTTLAGDPISPNGVFTLQARKLASTGSGDTTPASAFPVYTSVTPAGNVPKALNPSDPDDLGGVENNTAVALTANGSYQVARLTFSVAANAQADSYTLGFLQPMNQTNYAGPDPNNTAFPFNGFTNYTVVVATPEPMCGAAIAALGIAGLRRRRV